MKLEQQVVSLDLAKRLKELGVKQESTFYWEEVTDNFGPHMPTLHYRKDRAVPRDRNGPYKDNDQKVTSYWEEHFYAAFTVAELGEMLPGRAKWDIENKWSNDWICREYIVPSMRGKQYVMNYEGDNHSLLDGSKIISETNEADARAKMLIYLIENKLITV